ncbi:DUF6024 family protein [Candidatus Pantoea multigeneris]|nr:DUF6024 family protein [Pantoea multigeneris]
MSITERMTQARDELRAELSRCYHLEQFDLFFAPSLHVARVLLSRLFLRQEQTRNQRRYAAHYPITALSTMPEVPVMAGSINLVAQVDPVEGKIRTLQSCQKEGVVDVSETFATTLHMPLVDESQLFVTRLDHHAALPGGLVLIALRTQDFSTLVRSELRLFEQGMAFGEAITDALEQINGGRWQPYNIAMVSAIRIETPHVIHSCHTPGLPFALLELPDNLLNRLVLSPGMQIFPHALKLSIRAEKRGSGKKISDTTESIRQRLCQTLAAAG